MRKHPHTHTRARAVRLQVPCVPIQVYCSEAKVDQVLYVVEVCAEVLAEVVVATVVKVDAEVAEVQGLASSVSVSINAEISK